MNTRPAATIALAHGLLEHTRTLRAKIAVMCAGSVEHRLAMFLVDLASRFGDEADGGVIVQVPLSRGDLAIAVGATVETVIRTMSRWQKAGVLATDARGFVLRDLPALERLIEGFRVAAVYDGEARASAAS
jgi:CRP-like cAMP-binding protein